MSHVLSWRAAMLLAGVLAALCVALALHSSSASASAFCGGQTVSTNNPCFGAPRNMSGDNAQGTSHSVCVGINNTAGPCSSGPGQIATLNLGFVAQGATPWIAINVSGSTTVFGNTF